MPARSLNPSSSTCGFPPTAAGLYAAVALVGRVVFAFSSAVINTMFPLMAGTHREQRDDHSILGTSLLLVFGIASLVSHSDQIIKDGVLPPS